MMGNKFYYQLDGSVFDESVAKAFPYGDVLVDRDWRLSKEGKRVSNFVGFIIDKKKVLVSLPKHYCKEGDLHSLNNNDLSLLFKVLMTSSVSEQSTRWQNGVDIKSTYPFKSFFRIYDYYKRFGLYQEIEYFTTAGYQGKVSWKDTIKKSSVVVSNSNLILLPLQIKKSREKQVFLSDCMAFAICFTLENFPFFISDRVPFSIPRQFDFWDNKEVVLTKLRRMKSEVFKDIHKNLVQNLIDFFSEIDKDGKIIFKHYKFDKVWEKMVNHYLNHHFKKIDSDKGLVFDKDQRNDFREQEPFKNIDKSSNKFRFEIDHYYKDGSNQYIFDSKYYAKITGLNYKQVTYHQILMGENDSLKTYSALILPTENESSGKKHFELSEAYILADKDVTIWEYYLNIRQAMQEFIGFYF